MPTLSVGDRVPEITAKDQDGNDVSLSQFQGKKLVLYFYPKDDTPGCTKEACAFQDDLGAFADAGVEVVGVSIDDVASHKRFADKYGLSFTLLADPDKQITDAFGVLNPRGKARRVTFVIDESGVIEHVYPKVSPQEHSQEILNRMKGIEGGN
ncbi:MAG: peroxiredoxin [Candidatus Bipolaricaulia bacterium]